jgi:hypothetical protein
MWKTQLKVNTVNTVQSNIPTKPKRKEDCKEQIRKWAKEVQNKTVPLMNTYHKQSIVRGLEFMTEEVACKIVEIVKNLKWDADYGPTWNVFSKHEGWTIKVRYNLTSYGEGEQTKNRGTGVIMELRATKPTTAPKDGVGSRHTVWLKYAIYNSERTNYNNPIENPTDNWIENRKHHVDWRYLY